MIGIIDYGAGNLFSVKNALDYLQLESKVTRNPDDLEAADGLILPGVGAFPNAMRMLRKTGLIPVIRQEAEKKPLLGICLGMQMLFEKGFEFEETEGLGFIPGTVRKICANGYKIPHMGWNSLRILQKDALTKDLQPGDAVYFVHSFMADVPQEYLTAVCDYSEEITAFVSCGKVFGAQFHPEKSGEVGLKILRAFGDLCMEKNTF